MDLRKRHTPVPVETTKATSPEAGLERVSLLGETSRELADWEFRRHHPDPTIFLLMRFEDSPVMRAISEGVRAGGARHGRKVIRADDHDYTGEIWANVALCLRNSDIVIAVLDEIERRDCDANVMVELGLALGAGRRCLILVERHQRELPAVLRHRLTHTFDAYDVPRSVEAQVDDWLRRNVPRSKSETAPSPG